jgi:hypothetical protein
VKELTPKQFNNDCALLGAIMVREEYRISTTLQGALTRGYTAVCMHALWWGGADHDSWPAGYSASELRQIQRVYAQEQQEVQDAQVNQRTTRS